MVTAGTAAARPSAAQVTALSVLAQEPAHFERRIGRAARGWLYLSAAAFPLAYWPGLEDAYILPKLALARLLVAGLAIAWVLRCALSHRVLLRRTPVELPLIAFVLSSAVGTAVAVNRSLAFFGAYTRYESFLTHLTSALLFWLTLQTLERPEHGRALGRSLLAGGCLAAAYAVIQSAQITLSPGGPGTDTAFSFGNIARAYGTLGNPTLLGALMAMLLPLALWELHTARSLSARVLAINALIVMAIALVLTFSRSSWIGAIAGALVVILYRYRVSLWVRRRLATVALAIGIISVLFSLWSRSPGSPALGSALWSRLSSILDTGGSGGTRLHIWRDTLSAISHRPVFGFGPDNFALVYPTYQTGNWTPGYLNDKAHSDLLDVAVAQGLVGVVAMIIVMGAIVVTVVRRHRDSRGMALLGACVAYELAVTVNFSWLAVTMPLWLLVAAAVSPGARLVSARFRVPRRAAIALVPTVTAMIAAGAIVFGVVRPLSADRDYAVALDNAGDLPTARAYIAAARALSPNESQYAIEAGDLAFTAEDWPAAHAAYIAAAADGTGDPGTYVGLAEVDCQLGRMSEATVAWKEAVRLAPFTVTLAGSPC